jgi:uncharacterized protein (TIGR03435 family)
MQWLLISVAALLFGQQPAFEVASVKPSDPAASGQKFMFKHDGLTITNATLSDLVQAAYDVRSFQVSGGPDWFDKARYDLDAKNTEADMATIEPGSADHIQQTRLKLRVVLAERFKLKIHSEQKEMTEYALVLAKGGSKMQDEPDLSQGNGGVNVGCARIRGTRTTIANLVQMLSRKVGRPVIDRTSLEQRYTFDLTWTPDPGTCGISVDAPAGDGPSIFTAVQEQLGLKLEAIKAPVETIVVDRAEKPGAN